MTKEALFTFTTPLTLNIVEIKGEEHMYVEGDISTNDIDLVDDIMTKECQKSMQKQILERSMKLDIEHEAFKGNTHEEKEISKTKIPAGKLIDATVKDLGEGRYSTRVKGEINRFNSNYKSIQGNLIEQYLDAFSVAFLPTDVTYEKKEGKDVRMLNDVILLNVALTGNPCNTKAQLTNIMTKSMDAVEEYKRLKEADPSIEGKLVVKNSEKKVQALWNVTDKLYGLVRLTPKEIKLLKAALDVVDNKGAAKELEKELMNKISSGIKLDNKERALLNNLLEVKNEEEMELCDTAYKSNSSHDVTKKQLNLKNSNKMTEENTETPNESDAGNNEGTEGESVEQKAMLTSMSENMKTLSGKYEAIEKENVSLKEAVSEIAKSVAKITEALSNPIHKSPGVQVDDEEKKANAEVKSVDPLDACY